VLRGGGAPAATKSPFLTKSFFMTGCAPVGDEAVSFAILSPGNTLPMHATASVDDCAEAAEAAAAIAKIEINFFI